MRYAATDTLVAVRLRSSDTTQIFTRIAFDVSPPVRHRAPGAAVVLFNNGPLSWNGVVAFYVPIAALFVWMVAVTYVLRDMVEREYGYTATESDAVPTS